MRSRVLIGASAWLLGAVAATGGSMLAVSSLASGLLGAGTDQLSPAAVQNDLDNEQRSGADPTSAARPESAPTPSGVHSRPQARASASQHSPAASGAGTLLASGAGSTMARCEGALAYLQYWSPDQGYQATDVNRGPATQVSIVFEAAAGETRMRVTCQGGVPVARISGESGDDDKGYGGDE